MVTTLGSEPLQPLCRHQDSSGVGTLVQRRKCDSSRPSSSIHTDRIGGHKVQKPSDHVGYPSTTPLVHTAPQCTKSSRNQLVFGSSTTPQCVRYAQANSWTTGWRKHGISVRAKRTARIRCRSGRGHLTGQTGNHAATAWRDPARHVSRSGGPQARSSSSSCAAVIFTGWAPHPRFSIYGETLSWRSR